MEKGTGRRARQLQHDERRVLLERAQAVLDANWGGRSTVPSRSLYPHQWSWDAAFIAIGRSWSEQRRAQQELESLFAAQWADGMVPHIVFNPAVPADAYFPGPSFWQSERAARVQPGISTSGITQPPLHARAALDVYRNARDRQEALGFLGRLYPKLAAQHQYLAERRDPAGHGLAVIVHPWESGEDNSPIWDTDLDELQIAPGSLPPYRRVDLQHANPADRPTDAAYDRYVWLALRYRDAGYDDKTLLERSPFLVEPPLFNAIYLWSAHALAEIAELLGADPGPHRDAAARVHQGLLDHLWDPGRRRFYAYDVRQGRRIPREAIDLALPLLDPDLPGAMLQEITATLTSPEFDPPHREHYLIPSYELRGEGFDPRRYWRGPVWCNTDWLVWRGLRQHGAHAALADEIEGSMIRLVERSGFREYFDPFGGQGYGSSDFSWTAALAIDALRVQAAER